MTTIAVTCPRCGGTGLIPRYGHILKGLCFRCNGAKAIRIKARPDGTADHEHRLGGGYPNFTDDCGLCHLPVADWPVVVPAHFYGDAYVVYLPVQGGAPRVVEVPAETRRKGQVAVRALVAAEVPNFRIKWVTPR
jgi:hypothetical protein